MRLDEHVIHSNLMVGLDLNRSNRNIGGAFESTGQVINSVASYPDKLDPDLPDVPSGQVGAHLEDGIHSNDSSHSFF